MSTVLPPECEQLLITGYVLGNLSPAEALLLQEMLAENPDLNEQVVAMQEALESSLRPFRGIASCQSSRSHFIRSNRANRNRQACG